ncbi:hypothetical protein CF392_00320 [Tamilnaduibacter salinus]|uniref:Uncharacterized protein n=1 Tax=Tamilnaduibacter salinus TaxID=1484056 RepID=A0A2A2I8M9_9GAMM|nr:hypothetical protein [Tamilnaduibacter salinus]PAV27490.1 hypothetical protein CF392_00320 [Tamilnaduibacter salinus]
MKKSGAKRIMRWFLLVLFIVAALIFLNSALFSAWNAGGPPSDYAEAWGQRALVHLGYSGALFIAGVAIFIQIRRFPQIGVVPIGLLVIAGIIAISPHGRAFLAQDKCLDKGGKWIAVEYRCEVRD